MVGLTLYVIDAAITVVAENGTLNPITIVRTKIVVIILLNKFFMSTSLYLSYGLYHITNLFFVYPIKANTCILKLFFYVFCSFCITI